MKNKKCQVCKKADIDEYYKAPVCSVNCYRKFKLFELNREERVESLINVVAILLSFALIMYVCRQN